MVCGRNGWSPLRARPPLRSPLASVLGSRLGSAGSEVISGTRSSLVSSGLARMELSPGALVWKLGAMALGTNWSPPGLMGTLAAG